MSLSSLLRSLLPAALLLASCAYSSDYVVPNDGRARVVWQAGGPQSIVPPKSGDCALATREAALSPTPPEAVARCRQTGTCGHPEASPWVYVDVDHPHVPLVEIEGGLPLPPHPELPPLHPGEPVPAPRGGDHTVRPAPAPGGGGGHHASGGGTSSGGGGGSSSSGGSDSLGELAIAVAVVAILTMPVVAVALASARPESESEAAAVVDAVNAYNDLARTPGSACSAIPVPPMAPPDADQAPVPAQPAPAEPPVTYPVPVTP